jgi:cyclopropane fatty-acyl-phospholipid synthase-like methyltransferase
VEAENYRLTSREVWQAMAPGCERWRSQLADALSSLREWLIRELGPQPGETVLELGAVTGETGFEAAAMLGQDGRLISTDFSPAMLAAARRRGGERGLANVDYRLIDAERIELEADSVDGVVTGIEGPRANAPRPLAPGGLLSGVLPTHAEPAAARPRSLPPEGGM